LEGNFARLTAPIKMLVFRCLPTQPDFNSLVAGWGSAGVGAWSIPRQTARTTAKTHGCVTPYRWGAHVAL